MTDEIAEYLGLQTYQARQALQVSIENIKVFDKKQLDYGAQNIAANPCPELGVAIRANDKVQRVMNLLWNRRGEATNEPLDDAWLDLANYGLIGYLVSNDQWLDDEA